MLGSERAGQDHSLFILCYLALPSMSVTEVYSPLFPDTVAFPVFMGKTAQEHTLSLPLCLPGISQESLSNKPLVLWAPKPNTVAAMEVSEAIVSGVFPVGSLAVLGCTQGLLHVQQDLIPPPLPAPCTQFCFSFFLFSSVALAVLELACRPGWP